MTGLLFAIALLGTGFGAGYGLRAWISHRRRARARRARALDDASSLAV